MKIKYPNELEKLLHQGIKAGVFPGAVAYVSVDGKISFFEAVGNRSIKPEVKPMCKNTLFDLASLTKPVATATLAMQLIEKKMIDLDQCVNDILEEFDRAGITIKHLLTHTSGLPAWCSLYLDVKRSRRFAGDAIVSYLGKMPIEYETGSQVVYSCLGYILLGKLIERAADKDLDTLAREQIFCPLGMSNTFYNPPSEDADRCAVTEDSSSFQKRMTNNYERYDWREGVLVGQVHDENAHWLGGVAGNAGLFSTAEDLAKFCTALLVGGNGILSQRAIALMRQKHTIGLNGSRGLGWIIMPDRSLYHTGFTGTSIRIDLDRRLFAILLTNRVHPDATNTGILEFRNKFYGEIFNLRHKEFPSDSGTTETVIRQMRRFAKSPIPN